MAPKALACKFLKGRAPRNLGCMVRTALKGACLLATRHSPYPSATGAPFHGAWSRVEGSLVRGHAEISTDDRASNHCTFAFCVLQGQSVLHSLLQGLAGWLHRKTGGWQCRRFSPAMRPGTPANIWVTSDCALSKLCHTPTQLYSLQQFDQWLWSILSRRGLGKDGQSPTAMHCGF